MKKLFCWITYHRWTVSDEELRDWIYNNKKHYTRYCVDCGKTETIFNKDVIKL